jgi:hypothetical protein
LHGRQKRCAGEGIRVPQGQLAAVERLRGESRPGVELGQGIGVERVGRHREGVWGQRLPQRIMRVQDVARQQDPAQHEDLPEEGRAQQAEAQNGRRRGQTPAPGPQRGRLLVPMCLDAQPICREGRERRRA